MAAVLRSRRAFRSRAQCKNKLKQLGLAIHNYESATSCLPPFGGGTCCAFPGSNGGYLSGILMLLPYLDQAPLWSTVANAAGQGGVPFYPTFPHPATDIPGLIYLSSSVPSRFNTAPFGGGPSAAITCRSETARLTPRPVRLPIEVHSCIRPAKHGDCVTSWGTRSVRLRVAKLHRNNSLCHGRIRQLSYAFRHHPVRYHHQI